MNILGINAFHGDSSAVTIRDGAFVCGVEEERLNRVKHWAGFPEKAIREVLRDSATVLSEVPHVAISRDPSAHFLQKALFALRNRQGLDQMYDKESDGRAAILNALNMLNTVNTENPNAMIMQFFFKGKSNELAKIFQKSAPDEKNRALDLLTKLDISNINNYKQALQ